MLRPTDNIGSYELWLRAHALIFTHGRAQVFEALALVNRATTLDPPGPDSPGPATPLGAFCKHFGAPC